MLNKSKKLRIYWECKKCGTYQFVKPLKPCRHGGCNSKEFYEITEEENNSLFS